MEKLTGLILIAAAVLAFITLALMTDWWAERRAVRLKAMAAHRARLDAPVDPERYEAAAQRLVVEVDRLGVALQAERAKRAEERAAHELEADRFQEVVARLEWMLSLAVYDPISGLLDQMGPMDEIELHRRLGEGSSEAAFRGRLLAGLTAGLYRCARMGEEIDAPKLWWLDPQRPQAVLAFDAEAKRSVPDAVLEAERTVEALLALEPGPRR